MKKLNAYFLVGMVAMYASISSAAEVSPIGMAVNKSYPTTCAEEDNVNVPLRSQRATRFRVEATHPSYIVGDGSCTEDFSGCSLGISRASQVADTCSSLWDDGVNVVRVCTMQEWWRPYSMKIVVNDSSASGHYLQWYRKIEDEQSWPEFLVLYEDGNLRLKPHPPQELKDVCFGSSVISGPAAVSARPYVDIQEVKVNPSTLFAEITYKEGGTAYMDLYVDRYQASADVQLNGHTSKPITTFRSMWVEDGVADVDHIETQTGDFPILSDWNRLKGPWWFFHRNMWSEHNTSAPDILIDVHE